MEIENIRQNSMCHLSEIIWNLFMRLARVWFHWQATGHVLYSESIYFDVLYYLFKLNMPCIQSMVINSGWKIRRFPIAFFNLKKMKCKKWMEVVFARTYICIFGNDLLLEILTIWRAYECVWMSSFERPNYIWLEGKHMGLYIFQEIGHLFHIPLVYCLDTLWRKYSTDILFMLLTFMLLQFSDLGLQFG